MKKSLLLSLVIAFLMMFGLTACSTSNAASSGDHPPAAEEMNSASETISELDRHKIAVMVYDRGDDEVISFRRYLTEYIGEAFNVEFLYSDGVLTEDEAQEFIRSAAEYGAEGVMSFITTDLKAEVELCAELKLYYIVASGSVSNEVFASVEDNPYFLGTVGPGSFIEYKAGADMAHHFIEKHPEETEYFVLSGGGCFGNEMHLQRTKGILDTLANAYGVEFEKGSEEIARSDVPVFFENGELKICVCPGYHTIDQYLEMAKTEYKNHPYQTVLAVLPATYIQSEIKGAHYAVVDCYSETNLQLFGSGSLDYLVGKYSSIIGPSFAALYNAITGHAEDFRDHGKGFHITQGFWISDSEESFEEKYVLSSSVAVNAFNYEDLQQVIRTFNPDASLDDLRALAEAYTFKDAVARRAN